MGVPETQTRIARAVETALAGLPRMLDRPSGVFAFTTGPSGPAGQSLRYTCMTLIGLTAAARAGFDPGLDLDRLVRGLSERSRQITNLGELGLLLWCLADHHQTVTPAHDVVLARVPATPRHLAGLTTTELGWLLTGLSRAARLAPRRADILARAEAAHAALRANCADATGLFCYGGGANDPLRRRLRRELGFFDNQVYAICGGVEYARAADDGDALAMADRCLDGILAAQGPLGQWAWHYNVRTGAVVDRYPVYAVHQHGMGPMALHAVAQLTGRSVAPALERSLAWVFGDNELRRPMLDAERGVIWRSIRRRTAPRAVLQVFKLFSVVRLRWLGQQLAAMVNTPGQLEVDLECRPYELGWLLLACTRRWPTLGREAA
jgi:hypothetical protein